MPLGYYFSMPYMRTWHIVTCLALLSLALVIYGVAFRTVAEPSLPGALVEREMVWDGKVRKFTVYVPAALEANASAVLSDASSNRHGVGSSDADSSETDNRDAPGLVMVFHGSGGDAQQSRMMFGYAFEQLAEKQDFLVAYPQGYEKHFNGCRKGGPYTANLLQIDDVGFLRALVAHFVAEFGVSRNSVFATGVSNGGQMALRLALEAPDLVAAVAPIATSMPTEENMDCSGSGQPVAVLLMNGTDDPMNPYAGGTVALYGLLGDRGTVVSSVDAITYWARLAGHRGTGSRTHLSDRVPGDNSTVQVDRWGEEAGIPVALYTIIGGGHNAPHPEIRLPRVLGGTNNDINAAVEIMSFFRTAANRQASARHSES